MIRFALAAWFVLVSLPVHATTYTLEPDYTQGVFRWNHLGFSSPAAQFSQVQGTLEFDQADPTKAIVKATIPLSTLNTGVPALDADFKSDFFFDIAKFPTATFTSTKVEKGSMPDHLRVTGDLNMHGVIRPIILEVTVTKIGSNPRNSVPTVGFDAMTTLKRSDFGLGKFVPQVSDEIKMHIVSQAAEAKAYAGYLKAEEQAEAAEKAPKK